MSIVTVIGHFAYGKNFLDGQTIKTKVLTNELKKNIGKQDVRTIDTYRWKYKILKLIKDSIKALKYSENIIVLPGSNGVKFFIPFFSILNNFYSKKIHYSVIGGWLPEYLIKNKWLIRYMIRLEKIYVETLGMKNALEELGMNNVVQVPNFKSLDIITKDEINEKNSKTYKLCTFSRVLKEKGIEDAIKAIKLANKRLHTDIFTLDIYGAIDHEYEEEFRRLEIEFPEYINYKGTVPFNESVSTLKNYYALLFPTYYKGEGFAGTILDSYAAGLPVIASDWKYNSEIIKQDITGFIFKTNNYNELSDILLYIEKHPNKVKEMKYNCIEEAQKYKPDVIIKEYIRYF